MQSFIIRITQENIQPVDTPEVGCFVLETSLSPAFIDKFIAAARKEGKIVLFYGDSATEKYRKHRADGIIIDTSKDSEPQKAVRAAQKAAAGAVIGVICRNRRHEAMLVSECEPDFVIFRFWNAGFAENARLLEWYNELFLIQNAALVEEDCDFASLNADFIILDDARYKIFVAK